MRVSLLSNHRKWALSLKKLELLHSDTSGFDETWQQVWGEKQQIRNHYKQLDEL